MEAALGNPVVLRQIFSSSSFDDLKTCRLVNKFWSYEAGVYMRDFRKCTVTISGRNPCADLVALNQLVLGMTVMPINSLRIIVDEYHHDCDCQSNLNKCEAYGELLKKLSLKYLYVDLAWNRNRRTPLKCPVKYFVMDLFLEKLTELHTLGIYHFPERLPIRSRGDNDYDDDGDDNDGDWSPWLPKLQELYLEYALHIDQLIRLPIINGAPNLRKIKAGGINAEFLKTLPSDKYGLLDTFKISIYNDESEEKCLELAKAGPALSTLHFSAPSDDRYMQSFVRTLEELLTSSCKTLKRLHMDRGVYPLGILTLPALVSLEKLKFDIDNVPKLLNVLQSIDYPKLMPALSKLTLNVHGNSLMEGQDHWVGHDPGPFINSRASTSVNFLELEADYRMLSLRDVGKIFPDVRTFVLRHPIPFVTLPPLPLAPYADLWASWPNLEAITVNDTEHLRTNCDAQFLGINPEEVEILRELDDESLEKINIVPVRPSVLTMLRLRSLSIEILIVPLGLKGEVDPEHAFLSKLTGILAFKKMTQQGISVQLSTKLPVLASRLNHMSLFVPVITVDPAEERKNRNRGGMR